jgi:hypothetical protein
MKKVFKFIGYAFLAVIALSIFAAIFAPDKTATGGGGGSEPSAPAAPPEPLMQTTARDLARAYEENTVSADAKFKGKRFRVSGVITAINTDFMGDPVIVLRGGVNPFMEPQFSFDKSAIDAIGKLKKGSTITMECKGKGDVAKTPMSDDCEIVL